MEISIVATKPNQTEPNTLTLTMTGEEIRVFII